MGLREEKRTATRQQIISTAIELFTKRGYEATTIDDITKAARVAKGTFYYHFECKEELVMALGQSAMLESALRIQNNIVSGQTPLDALRDFLDSAAEWLTENPTVANVLFHYAVNNYRQTRKRSEPSFRRILEGFLAAGQERGEIRNDSTAQELAHMLSVLYVYSVMSWLEMPEITIKTKLRRCLNIFLEGILKKPAPTTLSKGENLSEHSTNRIRKQN
ncbi:MAG: TetR/AcrR family transcriptional regulator [Acidobacteria bacterium]|nr:TetR/AcrR family transcriptional regulator [Acidobacteriota bacterium]